jgi:hypothetical protein
MGIDVPAAIESEKPKVLEYCRDFLRYNHFSRKPITIDEIEFNIKESVKVIDFHYGDIPYPPATPTAVIQIVCINNSWLANEFTVSQREENSKKSSFEWGLNEQLKLGVSATVEAGLPGIFKGSMTVNTELDIGSNQTWNTEETQTWAIDVGYKVNMDPYTYNVLEMVVDFGKPEGEFEMTLDFEFNGPWRFISDVTKEDGSTSCIEYKSELGGFPISDSVILNPGHNPITIKGTFKADSGLKHYTQIVSTHLDTITKALEKQGFNASDKLQELKPSTEIRSILKEIGSTKVL